MKFIKKLLGITALEEEVESLQKSICNHKDFVEVSMNEMKKLHCIDADIGAMRGNNTIILTGVYKNKGYVKFYDMGDGEFSRTVEQIRDMKRYAFVRNVDKPYGLKGGAFEL